MSALYFHIPFCKSCCGYCDFHRSTALRYIPQTIEAMHQELELESDFIGDRSLKTIYFGGGTPSLLAPELIERFVEQSHRLFDCSQLSEITIELNPDDVTQEYVEALRQTSVNRISIGVQSLDDRVLRFMGRRHTAVEACQAVRRLQGVGYDNISVDIIFGIEGFSEALSATLQEVVDMGVQHISAYHLTIEQGSRFGRMLARGEIAEIAEEGSEAEFLQVHNRLCEAGFDHYEVSNYALEGFRSRHNSSYWQGVEYLGIGAGAHSFNGEVRRWCEQGVDAYIRGVEYGSEILSRRDRLNEYVMTSLRCREGLSLSFVERNFGIEERLRLLDESRRFVDRGVVVAEGDCLRLLPEKMLLSDAVITELLRV